MTNQIITKQLKGNIFVQNVEYKFDGEDLKGAEFRISVPFKKA